MIDVDRPPGHPDSIMPENDQIEIPANKNMSDDDRRQRVREVFEPYHDAVNRALARLWDRGPAPAIFSIHSFSPRFGDKPRPWDIGVFWNRDPRIADSFDGTFRKNLIFVSEITSRIQGMTLPIPLICMARRRGLPTARLKSIKTS